MEFSWSEDGFYRSSPCHRRQAFKLFLISVSFLVAIGVQFYQNRYISSGFFFSRRLPHIMSIESRIELQYFQSFPLSPFYNFLLKEVTGLSAELVVYLPLVVVIPIFWYTILSREVIENELFATLIAIPTAFFYIGKSVHFTEYALGTAVYPMFLYLMYRFISTGKTRYFTLVVFTVFLLKGFAPHAEVWAFSFLLMCGITIWVSRRIDNNKVSFSGTTLSIHEGEGLPIKIGILAVLSGILLFWFNDKFYTGVILSFATRFGNPIAVITEFFNGLTTSSSSVLKYGTVPHTPPISRLINTSYTLLVALILALSGLLVLSIILKERRDLRQSLPVLLLGIAVLSYIPDMILMMFAGQFQLFILRNTGIIIPAAIILLIAKQSSFAYLIQSLKIVIIVSVILIFIMGVSSPFAFVVTEAGTEASPSSQSDATGDWLYQNNNGHRLLTDLNTFGQVRIGAVERSGEPRPFIHRVFSDPRYAYLIGDDPSDVEAAPEFEQRRGTFTPPEGFDYVVLNWAAEGEPLRRGDSDWRYFEAIGPHKQNIESNSDLNRIYDNGSISVSQPL